MSTKQKAWVVRALLVVAVVAAFVVVEEDADQRQAIVSNVLGTTEALVVRGRLVEEEHEGEATTPLDELSQDEVDGQELAIALIDVDGRAVLRRQTTTGAEGRFEVAFDPGGADVDPGRFMIRVSSRREVFGEAMALILPAGHSGIAFRSDIDLTYLDTDFSSSSALADLLVRSGAERQTLPAMEVVYQALRTPLGSEELPRPLTFLSGSPIFFQRTLETRLRLDAVDHDGIVLKPFRDIAARNAADLQLSQIVSALEEQVGYKLTALLELRLDLPPDVAEALMGDDSEADVVAYSLYHRFTAGELDQFGLRGELEELGVAAAWLTRIVALAPRVRAHLGTRAPVRAIYINATARPNEAVELREWRTGDLVRHHRGAWPLALDLWEERWIAGSALSSVRRRLQDLGQTAEQLDAAARAGAAAGFLQPSTVSGFSGGR